MSHARELLNAVKENKTEVALRLLEETDAKDSKNDLCENDGDRNTPLHIAILNGNLPLAIALIKADPSRLNNVNKRKRNPLSLETPLALEIIKIIDNPKICETTLLTAAYFNQIEIVEALLKIGVKSHSYDSSSGYFPIHFAVYHRNKKMIRAFVEAGHNVNEFTTQYKTPFDLARDYECKRALLDPRSTPIESKEESKENFIVIPPESELPNARTLLLTVARNQTKPALALLKEKVLAKDDFYSENGNFPLHWAVRNKNNELIQHLIQNDLDRLKQKNIKQETPIQLAARLGDWERVKIIAKMAVYPCDPERVKIIAKMAVYPCDPDGMAEALLLASKAKQLECVQLLLEAGAKSDAYSGFEGYYGLHWAVRHRNERMIQAYMKAGHDPLIESKHSKETPLDIASKNKLESCVIALLQKPIEVVLEEKKETPQEKPQSEFLEKNEATVSYSRALLSTARYKNTTAAIFLLNEIKHCQPAENDWSSMDNGNSPLHWAVINNDFELIEALIKKDPKRLTQKNKNNETPIELASRLEQWGTVETITRLHDSIDGAGYGTALLQAVVKKQSPCVIALLNAKAPSDTYSKDKNYQGWYALHFLVKYGNDKLIQAFIDAGHNIHQCAYGTKIDPSGLASQLGRQKCLLALLQPKTSAHVQDAEEKESKKKEQRINGWYISPILADSKKNKPSELPSIESPQDLRKVIIQIASGVMEENKFRKLAESRKLKVKERILAYLKNASYAELDGIFSLNSNKSLGILGTPLAKFFAIPRGILETDPRYGTLRKFLDLEENYRGWKKFCVPSEKKFGDAPLLDAKQIVILPPSALFGQLVGEQTEIQPIPSAPMEKLVGEQTEIQPLPSAPMEKLVGEQPEQPIPSAPIASASVVLPISKEGKIPTVADISFIPKELGPVIVMESKTQAPVVSVNGPIEKNQARFTEDEEPGNPNALPVEEKNISEADPFVKIDFSIPSAPMKPSSPTIVKGKRDEAITPVVNIQPNSPISPLRKHGFYKRDAVEQEPSHPFTKKTTTKSVVC